MDREAWHAVIHGVSKSRARLSVVVLGLCCIARASHSGVSFVVGHGALGTQASVVAAHRLRCT